MKTTLSLVVSLMLCISLGACSGGCAAKSDDFVETSYKTLETGAVLYDTTMLACADLHRRGTITDEQYVKIKDAAEVYFDTYRIAVDALYVYMQVKDESAKAQLASALQLVSTHLDTLFDLAESVGVTVVGRDSATTTTPQTNSTEVAE